MGSPYTQTTYGGGDKSGLGASLRTSMGREGVDIGPAPDFEADWKRFVPRYQGAEPKAAAPRPQPQTVLSGPSEGGPRARTDYGNMRAPRPRDFGRFAMNQTGNWGTFVDAADVPVGSGVQPGFYGGVTNWDTSNPMISGHSAYGKTGVSAGGGGSYGGGEVGGGYGPQEPPSSNSGYDYLSPAEQARWRGVLQGAYGGGGRS